MPLPDRPTDSSGAAPKNKRPGRSRGAARIGWQGSVHGWVLDFLMLDDMDKG